MIIMIILLIIIITVGTIIIFVIIFSKNIVSLLYVLTCFCCEQHFPGSCEGFLCLFKGVSGVYNGSLR